ncbi:outer membrane lipoprotein carrier protein LolA [Dokdonia sp.]|uniref:LolA family protein n=1 Tax=Dokdonia sp. TaxID=2024995 RepID=UPI0032660A39
MNKVRMRFLMSMVLILGGYAFAKAQSAQSLLKEVDAKVKSYDNIAIDFKYALTNEAEGVNQETKGNVVLNGDLYALNLLGTTQLFDGSNIYTIVPEDEEVTISAIADQDETAITPSKMLSFFNDGYTQKMDISQKIKGRTIQYVKLTPMDSNSEVKHTLLGIDTETKHIYRLIIVQKNDTKITITVNSFKSNQPLSKNAFTFDKSKYADYYINKI